MQQAKTESLLVVRNGQGQIIMVVDKAGVNTTLYSAQPATTKDLEQILSLSKTITGTE